MIVQKELVIKSKLPAVGTTIFTVMSQLAAEAGALNLSQGFPNFDCSPELTDLVSKYLKKGLNQYAPMIGVQSLREKLAEKASFLYGVDYHPDQEVTITSGATEAIFAAITATVRPGDEVIVSEPAYDSYVPAIELNGGVPVYVTLTPPDYKIDWAEVREKITDRTKLILINTPHNPIGTVLEKSDLDELAELVKDTSIAIVSDEVYEHIIFDGRQHHSLMTHPVLRERTFICGSFGKTYHITGWKIGYCYAPKELSVEFRKVHQYLTFSTVTPIQYALADFLSVPDHYLSLSGFYQEKRDCFLEGLASAQFELEPAAGSFFQTVSYKHLTDENDYELAIRLTRETGVASIPVSVFYNQKLDFKRLRFCFAKDKETLQRAADLLSNIQW
jgi:methionine aminotransferase